MESMNSSAAQYRRPIVSAGDPWTSEPIDTNWEPADTNWERFEPDPWIIPTGRLNSWRGPPP